jgi:hypothetical protein
MDCSLGKWAIYLSPSYRQSPLDSGCLETSGSALQTAPEADVPFVKEPLNEQSARHKPLGKSHRNGPFQPSKIEQKDWQSAPKRAVLLRD